MSSISVATLDDGTYQVTVDDGDSRTVHEVTVTSADVQRLAGAGVTPERLVEASFEFLLEREPKEAILPRFALPVIERYFPDYPRAIRGRL